MSDVRRARLLLFALGALAASPLHAQEVARLRAEEARLIGAFHSLDSVERTRSRFDTLTIPGWTVLAAPEVRAAALREAPAALARLRAHWGEALLPPGTAVRIDFDSARYAGNLSVAIAEGWAIRNGSGKLRQGEIGALIAEAGNDAPWAGADPVIRRWAAVKPFGVPPQDLALRARVELGSLPDRDARGCRIGQLDACARALGLLGGDPVLSAGPRGSFFRFAVRQAGGDSALSRLAPDPSRTLLARFALATGSPPDTLLAGWRRMVLGEGALAAAEAASAVGGAAVLLLIGFGSARWRRV